ncbi:MAG: hypothetical protein WBE29_09080, partial [Pseudolabrys sp.]
AKGHVRFTPESGHTLDGLCDQDGSSDRWLRTRPNLLGNAKVAWRVAYRALIQFHGNWDIFIVS